MFTHGVSLQEYLSCSKTYYWPLSIVTVNVINLQSYYSIILTIDSTLCRWASANVARQTRSTSTEAGRDRQATDKFDAAHCLHFSMAWTWKSISRESYANKTRTTTFQKRSKDMLCFPNMEAQGAWNENANPWCWSKRLQCAVLRTSDDRSTRSTKIWSGPTVSSDVVRRSECLPVARWLNSHSSNHPSTQWGTRPAVMLWYAMMLTCSSKAEVEL